MSNVKIIGDSCSDLSKELRDRYDIGYAKMNVVIDGEEKPASLDWEYFTPAEFYGFMRAGKRVTTTQVPAGEFERVFSEALEAGFDVVYIGCSGKLSGSVNTARVVAPQMMEKYPGRTVRVVDPLNACMGEGLALILAAGLRDQGKSADEIADEIEARCLTINQFCTVNSLDALKRAGRVKASKAFFGNLFGVKPIIISDATGQNVPVKKVKGREASMDELVALMKEAITEPEEQSVYVGHADSPEDAARLAEKVRAAIPCRDVYLFDIGPIIGGSIGPDALVLYALGKKVEFVG